MRRRPSDLERALGALLLQSGADVDRDYLRVGKHRVHYLAVGSGPPVVLLHGGGGGSGDWFRNLAYLSQRMRVYAPDLLGFGLSDKPFVRPSRVIRTYVAMVRDFLGALNLRKASLVGMSLGGAVSLHFALAHPEMVDRLVLMGSSGLGKMPAFLRFLALPGISQIVTTMARRPRRRDMWYYLQGLVHDHSIITEEMVDYSYRVTVQPRTWKLGTLAKLMNTVLLDRLQLIPARTLLVWGEYDTAVRVEYARLAAERLLSAELRIFPESGHMVCWEKPHDFNRVVREFLVPEQFGVRSEG